MPTAPLGLAHVLEEEELRLYGPQPDAAPPRTRWDIRPDDVDDPVELARAIAARRKSDSAQWLKLKTREEVAAAINSNLLGGSQWLWELDGFADAQRGPYDKAGDVETFGADEVFNLNRQLLTELFPSHLRKAADPDERVQAVIGRIHARARKGIFRTALSISGGGIRSATFALGVLQGLAKRRLLEQFDFLSTVSGGGYIGSWLSSWTRRDRWGIRGVSALLAAQAKTHVDPEPPPIRHLRAFSNYLTPRLGLLSADTWALIATYLRNLIVNWIVLIPLLAGLLALPRVLVTAVVRDLKGSDVIASVGATVAWGLGVLLAVLALLQLVRARPVTDVENTKNALTDGRFVERVVGPFLLSAILLMLSWAWYVSAIIKDADAPPEIPVWKFIVFTAGPCLAAWGSLVWKLRRRWKMEGARIALEGVGAAVAGTLGGWLLWLATTDWFPQPVKELMPVGPTRWPVSDNGGLEAVTAAYVVFGVPILFGLLFLQAVIFVAASSHKNHDYDREWWARAGGWVLLSALGWIVLSAVAIYGPVGIYHLPRLLSLLGGSAGVFSLLVGWSDKTEAGSKQKGEESMTTKALNVAAGAAVPVFVLYVLALISLGTTWVMRQMWPDTTEWEKTKPAAICATLPQICYDKPFDRVSDDVIRTQSELAARAESEYPAVVGDKTVTVREAPLANIPRLRSVEHLRLLQDVNPWLMLMFGVVALAVALLMSLAVGVNVFSMHAMYRNRLVRAYLGASRFFRQPSAFTGFDARDNLGMHELRPEYVWAHSFPNVESVIDKLRNASAGDLGTLRTAVDGQLGDDAGAIFGAGDADARHSALYRALNAVIADSDLAPIVPKTRESEMRRPLRNRRFIERAFGDTEVYPSPMPILCDQDVLDRDAFESRAQQLFGSKALADVNARIESSTPVLPDVPIDPAPFVLDPAYRAHRMIENRLRIDAAFQGAIAPLRHARPLHVVNMCLNLTSGDELAWQERKGDSFTVTPLASGNHRLGYRDTRTYGNAISVGTAVTISGAAASPNMGYHSSPALAFLMTLFNVRLGWWLGNPGLAGTTTYARGNPKWSLGPLVHEATGNTNASYEYVYLSDGGHFDNLGLYEMVLRRCHRIVVSDAGADPKFAYDDLGNAMRKIRIDLGIEIEITHMGIIPPDRKESGKYCAVARIRYSDVDKNAVDGQLLYIKPVVYREGADIPRDILNYASQSALFPHESTGDQFFSESQFESYRRLGFFAMDQIGGKPVKTIDDLIQAATQYLDTTEKETPREPWWLRWARK